MSRRSGIRFGDEDKRQKLSGATEPAREFAREAAGLVHRALHHRAGHRRAGPMEQFVLAPAAVEIAGNALATRTDGGLGIEQGAHPRTKLAAVAITAEVSKIAQRAEQLG